MIQFIGRLIMVGWFASFYFMIAAAVKQNLDQLFIGVGLFTLPVSVVMLDWLIHGNSKITQKMFKANNG